MKQGLLLLSVDEMPHKPAVTPPIIYILVAESKIKQPVEQYEEFIIADVCHVQCSFS
jgi:hypothetical protein